MTMREKYPPGKRFILYSRTVEALASAAVVLAACGLPQIPEPYLRSRVSFAPVVFLRTEPQFLGTRKAPMLGGTPAQALGGNGFYITTSGCFVVPLSLKSQLLGYPGTVINDLQLFPAAGQARLEHIGDLDEYSLSVMRVTGRGTSTAFPLPDQPYKPQRGEKFLILTHELVIDEVESDGNGASAIALTDAWGEQKRVVAYWLKGRVEGGSLKRMSGAPVVNSRGEAIGLWVGRGQDNNGIFALPIWSAAVKGVLGDC